MRRRPARIQRNRRTRKVRSRLLPGPTKIAEEGGDFDAASLSAWAERVRGALKSMKMSQAALCRAIGMKQPLLTALLKGEVKNSPWHTVISMYLKVAPPMKGVDKVAVELIDLFSLMTDDQREHLVKLARSFVKPAKR